MEIKFECPLCDEELFSRIGNGCLMCGMPIGNKEEFCSEKCMKMYKKINYNIQK